MDISKYSRNFFIEIEIEISLLTKSGPHDSDMRAYTNNNYDWYTTTMHQTKYSRMETINTDLSRDFEKTTITAMYHDLYDLTLSLSKMRGGERNTCFLRSPWVTLPLNHFFPTHFVLFPSALIWTVDGTVCPAEYALYRLPCDLFVIYVCK